MNIRRGFNLVMSVLVLLAMSGAMRLDIESLSILGMLFVWIAGTAGLCYHRLWGWYLSLVSIGVVFVFGAHAVSFAVSSVRLGVGLDPSEAGSTFAGGALVIVVSLLLFICVITSRPKATPSHGQ